MPSVRHEPHALEDSLLEIQLHRQGYGVPRTPGARRDNNNKRGRSGDGSRGSQGRFGEAREPALELPLLRWFQERVRRDGGPARPLVRRSHQAALTATGIRKRFNLKLSPVGRWFSGHQNKGEERRDRSDRRDGTREREHGRRGHRERRDLLEQGYGRLRAPQGQEGP